MRKRHHIVSRGYQRFFADGRRIRVVEKATREPKLVGTRDAFVRKHFCAFLGDAGKHVDGLETEWTRLENDALPKVSRLLRGDPDPDCRHATKVIAAMHFARSEGFHDTFQRVLSESRTDSIRRLAHEDHIKRAWTSQFGAGPAPGEIEAYVEQRFDDLFLQGGRYELERMANAHNRILDRLGPLHVQLCVTASDRVSFITGAVPFVHFKGHRVGLRGRLAFGDADQLYMPFSPSFAVFFTTKPEPDMVAPPYAVQALNSLVWRASYRQVAAHPATNLARSLHVKVAAA